MSKWNCTECAAVTPYGEPLCDRPACAEAAVERMMRRVSPVSTSRPPAPSSAQAQAAIGAWHRDRFGAVAPGEVSLRLLREAVELCLADGVKPGRIEATAVHELAWQCAKGKRDTSADARRAEAADVGVVLMAFASREGWNLMEAVAERHAFNQTREVKR